MVKQHHLSKSAVLLTEENRRWIVPRQILPADSPLLQDLYRPGIPLSAQLERLAQLGVTYILTRGENGRPLSLEVLDQSVIQDSSNPVNPMGSFSRPFLQYPESERYFKEVYHGLPVPPSQDPGGYTMAETYLYEIVYPTPLQHIVDAPRPRPRPWLYEYATVGALKP